MALEEQAAATQTADEAQAEAAAAQKAEDTPWTRDPEKTRHPPATSIKRVSSALTDSVINGGSPDRAGESPYLNVTNRNGQDLNA